MMETNRNSLYGSLCQLFTLVSNSTHNSQDKKCRELSHSKQSSDMKESIDEAKNKVKRNAFKLLYSTHTAVEEEWTSRSQLYTCVFEMRRKGMDDKACALENAIEELDSGGKLDQVMPMLKLLTSIKPIKSEHTPHMKKIDPDFTFLGTVTEAAKQHAGFETALLPCQSYQVFNPNEFLVPSINYCLDEPYDRKFQAKLDSTQQLNELDVAHSHLFGALSRPPRSLDYLGISRRSKLQLGMKPIEEREETHLPTTITDEGYDSSPGANIIKPLPPVISCNYWENLDSLCDPSSIRKTWEAKLNGDGYPAKERPYLTEAPIQVMETLCREYENNLTLVTGESPRQLDSIKVDDQNFLQHSLYLTLGVESRIFLYQNDQFQLRGHIYVDGLSPECLAHLMKPLLACGRLVRSLNQAKWDPEAGFVHNSLVHQLRISLQFHQHMMVQVMKTKSLIAMAKQVKQVLPTLELMHRLWQWPGWSQAGRGVIFLQYLIHLATGTIEDQERRILTAYFAACVRPYLKYLESWIYKGQCCDSHQEFLIRVNGEQLVRRDRHYWTDGFALDPISRPSDECLPFVNSCLEDDAILGLVSDIYLCGKTVHLLQLCQTKDHDLAKPSLKIVLSLAELTAIRIDCEKYALSGLPEMDYFTRSEVNIGPLAHRQRQAKLAELVEAKRVEQSEKAIERSARHAAAKKELDHQLELKRAETKRIEKLDQDLDEDIKQYQEEILQRETKEKKRLLRKYAQLMMDGTDQDIQLPDSEDELNANTADGMDKDNNLIQEPTKPLVTALPVTASPVDPTKRNIVKTRDPSIRTVRGKKILTREEIRTKVLQEEFGIDPRYTKVDEESGGTSTVASVEVMGFKEWSLPETKNYSGRFNFSGHQTETEEARDWLQETKPCEEEIRDLSLSFFVQRSLLLPIRVQCQTVNRSLMQLLTGPEHRFMQHLEALRRFLFLNDGAFGCSLASSIGRRLDRRTRIHELINVPTMSFILQSAINSVKLDDYYTSRLSFYVKDLSPEIKTAVNALQILDCFTLRYRIGWPLNLILTETVMDDYGQIFSFVLQLRLAAWAVEDAYVALKDRGGSPHWHTWHLARHSIYHFVHTLQSYVMSQLLTLTWSELMTDLKKRAHSLDDLYEIHLKYIRRAKSRLLLTPKSASLMKNIRNALNLTLQFRSMLLTAVERDAPTTKLQSQLATISEKFHYYANFLRLIIEKFNDRSQSQPHLNELLVKLNFNDYYNSSS